MHPPWWSVSYFLLQSFQGLSAGGEPRWQVSSRLAGQLAAAAPPLPRLSARCCAALAQRLLWILEWPFGLPKHCNKALTEGRGKRCFIPYAFMESCTLSVPTTGWLGSDKWSCVLFVHRAKCAQCCADSRAGCCSFAIIFLNLLPPFFPAKPKEKQGCGLAHLLTMEGARTDQASLSHRALVPGLRGTEGQLPPALPSPAAAWHPAGPAGTCPNSAVQVSSLASFLFSSISQGKNPCEWVRIQLPEALLFALCAVSVCHSCASGWQNMFCCCWGEFDFDWKWWWGVSCGAQACSSSRGHGVTCLQCTGLHL